MKAKHILFPQVKQATWEEFTLPDRPGPHELIIRSDHSLISVGTELALYSGTHIGFSLPNPPFPMMPQRAGYALVGQVVAAGEQATGFRPGQRVLAEAPHGDYALVDLRTTSVIPLPDKVSDAQGALIRMASIALTAPRVAPLQLGESVAVYGLGLVGNLAAQLYQLNGGQPVIGIDRLPGRLEIARRSGVVTLDAAAVDVPGEALRLTGGLGPDLVLEATGSPAVVALSLDLVARGGRVVLLGSTRGRVDLDVYSHIHRKGVRLIGAHETTQATDLAPALRWPKPRNLQLLAGLFAAGQLRSDGLISHTIAPADLPAMYDKLAASPQDYLGILVDWR